MNKGRAISGLLSFLFTLMAGFGGFLAICDGFDLLRFVGVCLLLCSWGFNHVLTYYVIFEMEVTDEIKEKLR